MQSPTYSLSGPGLEQCRINLAKACASSKSRHIHLPFACQNLFNPQPFSELLKGARHVRPIRSSRPFIGLYAYRPSRTQLFSTKIIWPQWPTRCTCGQLCNVKFHKFHQPHCFWRSVNTAFCVACY